jgi:putative transposase
LAQATHLVSGAGERQAGGRDCCGPRTYRQTYGPQRLQQDLLDHDVSVGVHRIKRIRKKLNLRCKQKRKFKNTTDSKHDLPIAPNLLERRFAMSAPNQACVSDITYIWTDEGWLYLAGIKDPFNGELVGYAMGERMSKTLVMQALFGAVALKRPQPGLILHSDRGSTARTTIKR